MEITMLAQSLNISDKFFKNRLVKEWCFAFVRFFLCNLFRLSVDCGDKGEDRCQN